MNKHTHICMHTFLSSSSCRWSSEIQCPLFTWPRASRPHFYIRMSSLFNFLSFCLPIRGIPVEFLSVCLSTALIVCLSFPSKPACPKRSTICLSVCLLSICLFLNEVCMLVSSLSLSISLSICLSLAPLISPAVTVPAG